MAKGCGKVIGNHPGKQTERNLYRRTKRKRRYGFVRICDDNRGNSIKFPRQMFTSGLSRLIWWFKGSLVLRSTNRKIGYRGFLDEVIATKGGDFARVECEEGDIPATLLRTGPGIIVPEMRRGQCSRCGKPGQKSDYSCSRP